MAYKTIPEIETHCTELKIKGFAGFYADLSKNTMPMTITGIVDGKRFQVKTTGNMTIGDIVDSIVRQSK